MRFRLGSTAGPTSDRRPRGRRLAPVLALCAVLSTPGLSAQELIKFTNLTGQAVVVFDANEWFVLCTLDRVMVTTGLLKVNTDLRSTKSCPSELNAFSEQAGVLLLLRPTWSHSVLDPLLVTLPPVRAVDVRPVVVPGAVAGAATWAQTALNEAVTFLYDNRTGIRIAPSAIVTATTADQISLIGTDCPTVGTLIKSGLGAGVYDPDAINVYFVPSVGGTTTMMGHNCYSTNASGDKAPNVIFVSLQYAAYSTLTHELGHALGLRWLVEHTNPGAQDGREEFPITNLMYSYVDKTTAAAQNRFSLGQSYRMSLDTASWINRSAQPASTRRVKECQPQPIKQTPCPRLSLDLPSP